MENKKLTKEELAMARTRALQPVAIDCDKDVIKLLSHIQIVEGEKNEEIERLGKVCTKHFNFAQTQIDIVDGYRKRNEAFKQKTEELQALRDDVLSALHYKIEDQQTLIEKIREAAKPIINKYDGLLKAFIKEGVEAQIDKQYRIINNKDIRILKEACAKKVQDV